MSVPSLELGPLPHPLSRKRMCTPPPPPEPKEGGTHSPKGEGLDGVPIPTAEEKVKVRLESLKEVWHEIFDFRFFSWISDFNFYEKISIVLPLTPHILFFQSIVLSKVGRGTPCEFYGAPDCRLCSRHHLSALQVREKQMTTRLFLYSVINNFLLLQWLFG